MKKISVFTSRARFQLRSNFNAAYMNACMVHHKAKVVLGSAKFSQFDSIPGPSENPSTDAPPTSAPMDLTPAHESIDSHVLLAPQVRILRNRDEEKKRKQDFLQRLESILRSIPVSSEERLFKVKK